MSSECGSEPQELGVRVASLSMLMSRTVTVAHAVDDAGCVGSPAVPAPITERRPIPARAPRAGTAAPPGSHQVTQIDGGSHPGQAGVSAVGGLDDTREQ